MKALVFQGPGQTSWQDVPGRGIKDADDAVIRVDAVTVCGTDLHIVKGDVPEVNPGTVLGHEAVGDRVAMPRSCSRHRTAACGTGDVRTGRRARQVMTSTSDTGLRRVAEASGP